MAVLRPRKPHQQRGRTAQQTAAGVAISPPRVSDRVSNRWRVSKDWCKGFENFTGTMCYRHSTLQAMMVAPKFLNWLEDEHKQDQCVFLREECLSCRLRALYKVYWRPDLLDAKPLLDELLIALDETLKRGGWDRPGQQDAEEMLGWMIAKLKTQLPIEQADCISDIFETRLKSIVTCANKKCKEKSSSSGLDSLLRLPIKPETRYKTIKSYINKYMNEMVEGYRCEKCSDAEPKRRTLTITSAPDVLFIQLKRFDEFGQKDDSQVRFDHRLDLSVNLDDKSQGPLVYKLAATSRHAEYFVKNTSPRWVDRSTIDGHYIAHAKSSNGKWYECNDAKVLNISAKEAVDQETDIEDDGFTPYILCYLKT
ncbi:MAG: hypothetical protein M1837_004635 [Sclerophora amabilis]|nr:MAG: hypothetical protein M1837_004635 [Sclerophora amabilis]